MGLCQYITNNLKLYHLSARLKGWLHFKGESRVIQRTEFFQKVKKEREKTKFCEKRGTFDAFRKIQFRLKYQV